VLRKELLELTSLHPVEMKFRAEKADTYTVTISDSRNTPLTTRSIEIRDVNLEFQQTARDMETLRQWAAVSDGLALKAEECRDGAELVGQIKEKLRQVKARAQTRRPLGINGWMLALVLGSLAAEWGARKRWGLI
jgi:hypothetical protein